MPSPTIRVRALSTALALAASVAALAAAPAGAATATEQVTAGTLSFINSTPGDITFPGTTLNGTDQFKTQSQAFDVSDATGSAAGWSITATSTSFQSGTHYLDTDSTTIQGAPTNTCDSGATCTLASNSVSYPLTLPANTTAPPAIKIFNAALNSGMGNQTVTPTWRLKVPATSWANGSSATYSSTWTFTLVSGP